MKTINKTQQGFTLVELIIVIVILGILAVTAAPRFLNFQGDAKVSVLRGIEGSLRAAVSWSKGRQSSQVKILLRCLASKIMRCVQPRQLKLEPLLRVAPLGLMSYLALLRPVLQRCKPLLRWTVVSWCMTILQAQR